MKKTIAMLAVAATGSAMAADKITHSADFRYRTEMKKVEKDAGGEYNNTKQQIRLRVGVNYEINENTILHTRFATVGGNTSTNAELGTHDQTNANADAKKGLYVDQAYISHKCDVTGATFLVGKMANPLTRVSSLTFDGDYNPEGAAVAYTKMGVTVKAGNFWITSDSTNDSTTDTDTSLNAVQLSYAGEAGAVKYDVGLSHYKFDGGEYLASKIDVAQNEIFASVSYDKYSLFASIITNDAQEDDNKATDFGVKAKMGKAGLAVSMQNVGANSLNPVASNELLAGAADSETTMGTAVKAWYKLSNNTKVKLAHYIGEEDKDKDTYSKTKVDLTFKF